MGRKLVLMAIAWLVAALSVALPAARGATPGTPAADSALNFDPFAPNAAPAVAPASSANAGTASANSAAVSTPSATSTPRTVVCPPTVYVSVNDAPTVVQSATVSTTETFTVSLSADHDTPITVHYATADNGDGKAGDDYTAKSGTLTFAAHVTSLPVTVTILPEPGESSLEHYFLNLSNPTGATIARGQGVGTIQPPVINVATSNPPPIDQSTTDYVRVTINVTLSAPATTPITVNYTTADGTAKKNIDYQPIAGSITFPPGVTTEPVKVYILPGTSTSNRNFFLDLSGATGAPGVHISVPTATVTIVGQNGQNVAGLSVNDVFVTQSTTSNVTGSFTVTLSTAAKTSVTVKYATADIAGQAVAGVDYSPTSGTLTFAPGVTTEVVPFTVLKGNNTTDKTFHLLLSNAVGAPINRGTGTATILPPILDVAVSDAPPVQQSGLHTTTATFTVTLSGLSANSVKVSYFTSDGTAIHGTDYVAASGVLTFTPYTLTKTVNVTVLTGSSTTNRNFFLNLNNPSPGVVITRAQGVGPILGHQCNCVCLSVNDITVNQSSSATTTATFTVTLTNAANTYPVTVTYATANGPSPGIGGGAEAGEDYTTKTGTLTFNTGDTVKTVTVTILKESENYAEHFFLNLSNPSGAVICRAQGTCTIIPPTIDVAVADSPTVHRSPSATTFAAFNVTLSSINNAPVTVKYATADGTAVHNVDYTTTTGTLTFPALTTSQTVLVPVLPGAQSSGKTFYLNLSNVTGAGAVISRAQGSALVEGPSPMPTLSVNDINVIQNKSVNVTATFTVTLSGAAATSVTVHYATANGTGTTGAVSGSDYITASGTLTFAPGETTHTVTVTILPENQTNEEVFVLNLSGATGATIGDSQGTCSIIPAMVDVSVNNPALVQRQPSSNTTVTFTITLSAAANTTLTVDYATSDGTAIHSVDYDAKSGSVTFSPGDLSKTVTVTVLPGSSSSVKTFFLNLIDAVGPPAFIATPKGTAQIKG